MSPVARNLAILAAALVLLFGAGAAEDGRPVAIEPYLGADGHLVALREGVATVPTITGARA